MSMAEPFLPAGRLGHQDRSAAAEPGPGGPTPLAPEEPDVLPGASDPAEKANAPALPTETAFRTPTPGERLHPEDLEPDADA
jgi:hypothetical protein